jgi:hypothetical protein
MERRTDLGTLWTPGMPRRAPISPVLPAEFDLVGKVGEPGREIEVAVHKRTGELTLHSADHRHEVWLGFSHAEKMKLIDLLRRAQTR